MASFYYQSIDLQGKKQKGTIDALNEGEAKEKLRKQGVFILSLKPHTAFLSWERKKNIRLSKNALFAFTTQLSQLIAAKIPLYESLVSLEEQYRGDPCHSLILSLGEKVKQGLNLSEALKSYPESFDNGFCAMVAAGEAAGALDTTLLKLAEHLEKKIRLERQLFTAMLYPALLGGFAFLVLALLLFFVVPSLEVLFEDRPVNGLTSIVLGVSQTLRHHALLFLACASTFLGALIFFLKTKKAKALQQKLLISMPLLKTLMIQTAIARFCRTMATLLSGGVSIIQALQISRHVVRLALIEEIIEKAEKRIIEGSLLSKELALHKLIPSLVPRMLSIGEEGGRSAEMFQKIAQIYESETEKSLARLTALAQPLILVILGGLVGLILFAVLMPLTDVTAFLNT